ncbi:MAG: hypothetical protein JRH11_05735 [Deltaproteobacteria bacterium]|nr:hypothetical protein [Deltaproteobacteria bacterium]
MRRLRKTLVLRSLLSVLLLGSACGDDEAVDAGGDAMVGHDAMVAPDAGFVAPPEIPWLAAGIPPFEWPCPSGWQNTTEGNFTFCTPYADAGPSACPAGEAHFVGEPGCRAIGAACPSGEFADGLPSDGSVVFVSPGASPGGNGTMGSPYPTLAEVPWSTLTSGTTVALGKGTYPGIIRVPAGVHVVGACVNETVLTGAAIGTSRAVIYGAAPGEPASVRDLSIVDPQQFGVWADEGHRLRVQGVLISGAAGWGAFVQGVGTEMTLADVVIRDTRAPLEGNSGAGILAVLGGRVEAVRVVVEDSAETGVIVASPGSEAELTDVAIIGSYPTSREPTVSTEGRGLDVEYGASVVANHVYLQQNHESAIFVAREGARVALNDAVITDTLPRSDASTFGAGIFVGIDGHLSGSRVVVLRSAHHGLSLGEGGSVELTDALVLDTRAPNENATGIGVYATRDSTLSLTRFGAAQNRSTGIIIGGPSEATLVDILVQDTLPSGRFAAGYGLVFLEATTVNASRLVVEGNRMMGIGVILGSTLTLTDAVIRNTLPAMDGAGSYGIFAASEATLDGTRVAVDGASSVGVISALGGRATLRDLRVTQVARPECEGEGCAGRPGGHGVSAEDSTLTIERFAVLGSELCGVFVAQSSVPPEVDLMTGVVAGSRIGACLQAPGYDVERLTSGVVYMDNETNFDTNSRLPLPPPPSL